MNKAIRTVFWYVFWCLVAAVITLALVIRQVARGEINSTAKIRSPLEKVMLEKNRGGLETKDDHGRILQFGKSEIVQGTWQYLPNLCLFEVRVGVEEKGTKTTERILITPKATGIAEHDNPDHYVAQLNKKPYRFHYAHVFARLPEGQSVHNAVWSHVLE